MNKPFPVALLTKYNEDDIWYYEWLDENTIQITTNKDIIETWKNSRGKYVLVGNPSRIEQSTGKS